MDAVGGCVSLDALKVCVKPNLSIYYYYDRQHLIHAVELHQFSLREMKVNVCICLIGLTLEILLRHLI